MIDLLYPRLVLLQFPHEQYREGPLIRTDQLRRRISERGHFVRAPSDSYIYRKKRRADKTDNRLKHQPYMDQQVD